MCVTDHTNNPFSGTLMGPTKDSFSKSFEKENEIFPPLIPKDWNLPFTRLAIELATNNSPFSEAIFGFIVQDGPHIASSCAGMHAHL
jgi:hypothetical protein